MIRLALTDSFHLHERNFPSLFKCLQKEKIEAVTFLEKDSEGYGLITSTGRYDDLEERVSSFAAWAIRTEAKLIASYDADTLYRMENHHIGLWPLCRSELLAYLLTFDTWQQTVMEKDDRAIFDKAFNENHEDLAINMAIASFWLNHWYNMRKEVFKNHFVCLFSGSMTYTRTLMELLRRSPSKAIVMESTFTGNDFIFEEMYHPVANNLGVQSPNLRTARRQSTYEEPNQYEREIIKARNKVLSANNKNVTQPPDAPLPKFPNSSAPQVLIVGQVANDFSLIENGFPYVGSIPVYRTLIDKILDETDYNIVFKAHPWENKKVHLKTSKTFDSLAKHFRSLDEAKRSRLLLVEDVNLYNLIESSDYLVTLCSQASIEGALLGMRPFVLGKAFYSAAGFTVDSPDIESLVASLSTGHGILTLEEYQNLDRFLVDLFQYGTVSVYESGEKKIRNILQRKTPLEQKAPIKAELNLQQANAVHVSGEAGWSPVLRKKQPLPEGMSAKDILRSGIQILVRHWPETFSPGSETTLPVALRNTSDFLLPAQLIGKTFELSYHIFDEDNRNRIVWNGERQALLGNVVDERECTLHIKAPDTPGRFLFQPALLLPGAFWVESQDMLEMIVA